MPLTRDQIVEARDLRLQREEVPEWGGDVFVREMSAGQRVRWEELSKTAGDSARTISLMLASTLCDENGVLLFTIADVELLEAKNANVLIRLVDAVKRVNAINQEDIDTLAKN